PRAHDGPRSGDRRGRPRDSARRHRGRGGRLRCTAPTVAVRSRSWTFPPPRRRHSSATNAWTVVAPAPTPTNSGFRAAACGLPAWSNDRRPHRRTTRFRTLLHNQPIAGAVGLVPTGGPHFFPCHGLNQGPLSTLTFEKHPSVRPVDR